MRLSQEVISDLAVLLRRTSVSLACEEAGVSVGSYYRWHWESRRLSLRRVPNAVDTPYERLLREFGRVTRASRKRYLACKRRVRAEKGVVRKRRVKLESDVDVNNRKRVLELCKETALLTSSNFDF